MRKADLNYALDGAIGVAFVLSAASGLVFLIPSEWLGTTTTFLGLTYVVWSDLHTYSSLAMIAGVLAHLALHWKWIASMTRKNLAFTRSQQTGAPAAGVSLSRRRLLLLGSAALLGAVVASVSGVCSVATSSASPSAGSTTAEDSSASPAAETLPVVADSQNLESEVVEAVAQPTTATQVEAVSSSPTTEATPQILGVACRKGIANDPYPGRCHSYRDTDGDGICDYSVLGSGSFTART